MTNPIIYLTVFSLITLSSTIISEDKPINPEPENVIAKFYKYDSISSSFVLLPDYEFLYPNSTKYKSYIGLKRENGQLVRKHILLDYRCCKILRECTTKPYFETHSIHPFVSCVCESGTNTRFYGAIHCLKAYMKSNFNMRTFANQ
ncbi:MAG: hypothetical protein IPM34_13120 [Saprospiraceae bacterium]|nr:hypothetical protein [Saprospiraceae bacterium]